MKTEFDNLRLNPLHNYDSDKNGNKEVVKIYLKDILIAKKVTLKKTIRYFGAKGYQQHLTVENN